MKLGQRVALIGADGERQSASVTAVPGTGKSGNKTLDLEHKGGPSLNVVHGDDRVEGEAYWLLPRAKDEAPEVPEELEPAPAKKPKKAKAKAK